MGRQILTLILVLWTLNSLGQTTILLKPFLDDHKIFTDKDKSIGFVNLDKYDKAWLFAIDQFNTKTLTVNQINDSLFRGCNDSIASTVLKNWYRLSVDSVSIKQTDNIYDLTIGMNNIYNEDKSGIFGTIYFYISLYFDSKTNQKRVNEVKYIAFKKLDD